MVRISSNKPARHICFTYYPKPSEGETPEDVDLWDAYVVSDDLKARFAADPKVSYAVWQFERCPTSQLVHLQGYIELKQPERRTWIKKLMGSDTVHLESRQGTRDQARDYCMDERKAIQRTVPVEYGKWVSTGQGTRTDLNMLHEDLQAGSTLKEVSNTHFSCFMKYPKAIQLWKQLNDEKRNFPTEIHLYLGPAGCGKSKMVHESYPEAYWKPAENQWFPNYCGENDVVFDEFSGSWMTPQALLRMADRYPLLADVKGSHVNFRPKRIHITSNYGPGHWWPNAKNMNRRALERRIVKLHVWLPLRKELVLDRISSRFTTRDSVEVQYFCYQVQDSEPLPFDDIWNEVF